MKEKENVKLVFETISKIVGFEIMPDKDFYVVANGNKIKSHIRSNLTLMCETSKGCYERSPFAILPILKGSFTLEEIKEPLLTDEGKNFLRHFKFEELSISNRLYMYVKNLLVASIDLKNINVSFDGLQKYKKYTSKELGL